MRGRGTATTAAVLAMLLAACGEEAEPRRTSATEHNAADAAFASDMVQHHAQALALVDLARGRDVPPELVEVTEAITLRLGPEVETLTDWLVAWDEEIPSTVRDHVNAGHGDDGADDGADHGAAGHEAAVDLGRDLPGMPEADDLAELEAASEARFPDLWLATMTEHHEGAVELAREEQTEGIHEPALDLAEEIEAAQQAELEAIEQLTAR